MQGCAKLPNKQIQNRIAQQNIKNKAGKERIIVDF
jgi:hypothetical protein